MRNPPRPPGRCRLTRLAGPAVALLAATWAPARACDVPTYAYAMREWPAQHYTVIYLSRGPEDAADQPVNQYLKQVGEGQGGYANVTLLRVDVQALPPEAPQEYRDLVDRMSRADLPTHVVMTPRWQQLHAGRLDLQEARALVQSPAREKMGETLCAGKQGLLLLVTGSDAAANDAARAAMRQAVELVKDYDLDVSTLEVAHDAVPERWLVRQLAAFAGRALPWDEPVLFAAFGRGHVEGPDLVGGTTMEEALVLIDFMVGPCTCLIREQALGADLLTNWDWSKAVEMGEPGETRPTVPGGYVTF